MPDRDERGSPRGWPRLLRWVRRQRFRVADRSMTPTLLPGDRLYVDRRAYRDHPPVPGDVIVAWDPEEPGRYLVKRVAESPAPAAGSDASVFLVGDDPGASRDSRHFGSVPTGRVVGRVYRCYSPPERRRDF